MCLLCIEIAKGSMTAREIASAYIEISDFEHQTEVMVELSKKGMLEEVSEALTDKFNEAEKK